MCFSSLMLWRISGSKAQGEFTAVTCQRVAGCFILSPVCFSKKAAWVIDGKKWYQDTASSYTYDSGWFLMGGGVQVIDEGFYFGIHETNEECNARAQTKRNGWNADEPPAQSASSRSYLRGSFWPCSCPFTGSRCCSRIQITTRQERIYKTRP